MSPATRIDRATAERHAGRFVDWSRDHGELIEIVTGFGNHNWRVPCPTGDALLKIGPVSSRAKWTASQLGADGAAATGVPVPRLRSVQQVEEHLVRTFDWVEGVAASTLFDDRQAQARLGADLGRAVAALHRGAASTEALPGFSSRLDGTAPSFRTWPQYVVERLRQIEARSVRNDAPEPALRRRAQRTALELSEAVADRCRPVVCHRDLHADNLIVRPDGSLVAIVDWDMAEAWDAAGEWFKLELFLFDSLPASREPFETAYAEVASPVEADRRQLVVLLECLNVVANAGDHAASFTAFGLSQLEAQA